MAARSSLFFSVRTVSVLLKLNTTSDDEIAAASRGRIYACDVMRGEILEYRLINARVYGTQSAVIPTTAIGDTDLVAGFLESAINVSVKSPHTGNAVFGATEFLLRGPRNLSRMASPAVYSSICMRKASHARLRRAARAVLFSSVVKLHPRSTIS